MNDRLYDDLCHSSFLYEIQTEFRDYCVRKNIKEQSLFLMDPPSPQEPVSPSGPQLDPTAPSSCGDIARMLGQEKEGACLSDKTFDS